MALLRMHKDVYPPHGARDIETPDEPSRPMLAERYFPEPVGAPEWFYALWKKWAEAVRDAAAFVYGDSSW